MPFKISFIFSMTLMLLSGCSNNVSPDNNQAITSKQLSKMSTMELLESAHEMESTQGSDGEELFFADTKGKIFYGKSGSGKDIAFRTNLLLSKLLNESKTDLPKTKRGKKLNISLELVDGSLIKSELLNVAEDFVFSHKGYHLTNTDDVALSAIQRVLKKERDGIYRRARGVKTRDPSDVIILLEAKKVDNFMSITTRLLSKNGQILGKKTANINVSNKPLVDWVEVEVPRNNGVSQTFKVMVRPVNMKEFTGVGTDTSITNVSFSQANNFCIKNMQAALITPYVFENARKSMSLGRTLGTATIEMISPFDEEDDEEYYQEGDELYSNDSNIIIFHWNSEKYFSTSNLYKSHAASFRCMRAT